MRTTLIKIKAALLAIRARFTPSTGNIVAQFDKLTSTIEAAIAKDDAEAQALLDRIHAAEDRLDVINANSSKATRMLVALRAIV